MTGPAGALCGITTPLVTPFDGDRIDWDGYDAVLEHVLDSGVDAVFPCGTTGEVASLTAEERCDVIRRTVAAVPTDVPVLAGGTGTNVADSRDWIDTVAGLGVDGIVATAPYFHPANDPAGYRHFFEQLADDSPLPIVLYNIPACVGKEIPLPVVEAVASHQNIIGLKDSGGDLTYGMAAVDRTPDEFLLLQGFDSLLLPSLLLGFDGGVNAVSNAIPTAYADVMDAPQSGRSRSLHDGSIRPLFDLCRKHGFATGVKAILARDGVIDSTQVRPPLVPVPAEKAAASLVVARGPLS